MKMQHVFVFEIGGELTQCLTHQASLEADGGVAHVTLNFFLRRKSCHGVDDEDVDG